jgi:predicted metal-dependent phosphoesterase TrpH
MFPELPCWGLVDYRQGVRVAGWIELREIGGVEFVAVTPHDKLTLSIAARLVDRVLPCSEQAAKKITERQWVA